MTLLEKEAFRDVADEKLQDGLRCMGIGALRSHHATEHFLVSRASSHGCLARGFCHRRP